MIRRLEKMDFLTNSIKPVSSGLPSRPISVSSSFEKSATTGWGGAYAVLLFGHPENNVQLVATASTSPRARCAKASGNLPNL